MSTPIIYPLPQVSIASRLCAKSTISLFIADHYLPFVLATCYIKVHLTNLLSTTRVQSVIFEINQSQFECLLK